MRLWTLHPKYLDRQGLTALWREGLLAQAVLRGRTCGYRSHPQLDRFRAQRHPLRAIAAYLLAVQHEAARRGYRFDRRRVSGLPLHGRIAETRGQLLYEWQHLLSKLARRNPDLCEKNATVTNPAPHPLFRIVRGRVRPWEKRPTVPGRKG